MPHEEQLITAIITMLKITAMRGIMKYTTEIPNLCPTTGVEYTMCEVSSVMGMS